MKNWITLNEIRCFTILGYTARGRKAPGRHESDRVVNQTFHNALVCHGLAVRAVRRHGGPDSRVGLTDNCDACIPVTETEADIAAAKAWFVERNLHILDAIYRGSHSPDYLKRVGKDAPAVEPGDFALISAPTDFLGVNLYTGYFVRAKAGAKYEVLPLPAIYPRADSDWLFIMATAGESIGPDPQLRRIENYGPKEIYITENGCGYNVEPVVNGEVLDLHRREFLREYLRELHRAIAHGVPVKGYFLWSFMDNYEWEDGYTRRFGIVHIDFATQKRTPKLSARYYSDVIRLNRIV